MDARGRDRGPAPPRKALTRARILEAALQLVDREGSQALTMRRLAGELGVAAMSLYNHVAGREELLDGLSEVMVARIGIERDAMSPRAALHGFIGGIRAVARAHPQAFELVGMRPLHTPEAYRPVEAALAALRTMGFAEDEAVHAYRTLVAFARGFALAEIRGFSLESAGKAPDAAPAETLDPEAFPTIVELLPHLAQPDRDAAFAFGAGIVVAGLEGAAEARAGW